MTIYRRWPSKNDLLKAVIIGEFTTLLDAAFDDAAEESASFADRSLKAFTDVVWAVQSRPEGYTWGEVPRAFVRVAAGIIH